MFYAAYVTVLCGSIHAIKKNAEASVVISKGIGAEVCAEYMVISQDQHTGQNYNIKVGNKSFERVEQFRYLVTQ